MEVPESQNSRDARIERLWAKLDPQKKGELDIHDLKKGLARVDHPLKNADQMLKAVIGAMDKNGDEKIQYEEFRMFVEKTELELLSLFNSIDGDRDHRLDKEELRAAFKRAGLAVPSSKLDTFFSDVDKNHDGYITFEEWRNFLLFIPTHEQPGLKAVLSYYSSTITLNSEGDPSISEETYEGLGESPSFLKMFFGAIVTIAEPPKSRTPPKPIRTASAASSSECTQQKQEQREECARSHALNAELGDIEASLLEELALHKKKTLLTGIWPEKGYFAAGAIAGVVSRTLTAPLDRLKVYLIANIGPAKGSLSAAAEGDVSGAAKQLGRPLIDATKELWKAGGVRSLFAGNGLNVLKVMPESALKFGSFETAKRAMAQFEGHGDPKKINPYSKFLAGGVGGVVSQIFVYPIDTLKFRMQCETVEGGLQGNALIAETAKKMMKEGALKTSYRGLTMGLVGMFPYAAIDLSTYEYLKGRLTARNARILGCHEEDAEPGGLVTAGIGAFSGALGASIVYPLNLLRTRLQAQGTVLHPPTYTGIWDVAQKTVKNEGIRGLFKGIAPNLIKVVPAVSITYVVYDSSKKALKIP